MDDHGRVLKFAGSKPFPRGRAYYGEEMPEGAVRLQGYRGHVRSIEGAEWIFGGLMCQRPDICTCHNLRYDMDYFARHWLPANQLHSVVVIDANANLIARLGRYGNVDDKAKDIQSGGDGLRFVWPRAIAVSDTALYVADHGNCRIVRATRPKRWLAYLIGSTMTVLGGQFVGRPLTAVAIGDAGKDCIRSVELDYHVSERVPLD